MLKHIFDQALETKTLAVLGRIDPVFADLMQLVYFLGHELVYFLGHEDVAVASETFT